MRCRYSAVQMQTTNSDRSRLVCSLHHRGQSHDLLIVELGQARRRCRLLRRAQARSVLARCAPRRVVAVADEDCRAAHEKRFNRKALEGFRRAPWLRRACERGTDSKPNYKAKQVGSLSLTIFYRKDRQCITGFCRGSPFHEPRQRWVRLPLNDHHCGVGFFGFRLPLHSPTTLMQLITTPKLETLVGMVPEAK